MLLTNIVGLLQDQIVQIELVPMHSPQLEKPLVIPILVIQLVAGGMELHAKEQQLVLPIQPLD